MSVEAEIQSIISDAEDYLDDVLLADPVAERYRDRHCEDEAPSTMAQQCEWSHESMGRLALTFTMVIDRLRAVVRAAGEDTE